MPDSSSRERAAGASDASPRLGLVAVDLEPGVFQVARDVVGDLGLARGAGDQARIDRVDTHQVGEGLGQVVRVDHRGIPLL